MPSGKTPLILPPDATLETVLPGLVDAEEYVRRIFERLRGGRLDQVRIGVRSDAKRPDYMLDQIFQDEETGQSQAVPMEAYSGKTHRPVSYARWDDPENWSRVGMLTAEVQQLLGSIRGWVPRRRR